MSDVLPNEWLSYFAQSFSGVNRSADDFFVRLWQEGRLQFRGRNFQPDKLNELSASLVCATLHQRERLLIVLPDKAPQRPSLLFATGIIMHGLDRVRNSELGGQVLYFGSKIGIRDQLSNVQIGNLTLDDVFPQSHVKRQNTGGTRRRDQGLDSGNNISIHLPKVICVYAPADPVDVLKRHPADWVAIDCGDEPKLRWLPSLLEYACACNLPIVAWCQNSLSESISEFAKAGIKCFRWPWSTTPPVLSLQAQEKPLGRVCEYNRGTQVTPLLVEGLTVAKIIMPLQNAYRLLARAGQRYNGRLSRDALHIGWAYLRSIESLVVPYELYEAESRHKWGLKSIARLREGLERFVEATRPIYAALSTDLEEVAAQLDDAIDQIRQSEPPLWEALTKLCISDVPDGIAYLIVFPSAARRELFTFSLLARYNITPDDLKELRVWLSDPKDLSHIIDCQDFLDSNDKRCEDEIDNLPPNDLDWHILLVGLPGSSLSARLEPALRQKQVKVLILPYQIPALTRRIEQWQESLNVSLSENLNILIQLGGKQIHTPPPELPAILRIDSPQTITAEVRLTKPHWAKGDSHLWQPSDPVEEISWLLAGDEEEEILFESSSSLAVGDTGSTNKGSDGKLEWVEQALQVHFDGGWHGLFASDETINVIYLGTDDEQVEERYIKSIRPKDRVLFIHGQRRQSLYDLIISRVHKHPAIELHVALVHRWQADFVTCYEAWQRRQQGNVDKLLYEMQKYGSQRGSVLTLRQWLRGETLCPQDAEDLFRLAEILDMGFVKQHYERIYRAASRIRGLHRGLANRLNRWLREQATGIDTAHSKEVFDEELGLSLQDFRDSLLILRVASIVSKPGPFLRSNLGLLERGGRNE